MGYISQIPNWIAAYKFAPRASMQMLAQGIPAWQAVIKLVDILIEMKLLESVFLFARLDMLIHSLSLVSLTALQAST